MWPFRNVLEEFRWSVLEWVSFSWWAAGHLWQGTMGVWGTVQTAMASLVLWLLPGWGTTSCFLLSSKTGAAVNWTSTYEKSNMKATLKKEKRMFAANFHVSDLHSSSKRHQKGTLRHFWKTHKRKANLRSCLCFAVNRGKTCSTSE